jgi:hypothetical protein
MYGLPKSVIIKTKKELLELHKRCIVSYLTSRDLKHSKQKQFFKVYDVYVSYKNIDNYFHRPIKLFVYALITDRLKEITYYVTKKKLNNICIQN